MAKYSVNENKGLKNLKGIGWKKKLTQTKNQESESMRRNGKEEGVASGDRERRERKKAGKESRERRERSQEE